MSIYSDKSFATRQFAATSSITQRTGRRSPCGQADECQVGSRSRYGRLRVTCPNIQRQNRSRNFVRSTTECWANRCGITEASRRSNRNPFVSSYRTMVSSEVRDAREIEFVEDCSKSPDARYVHAQVKHSGKTWARIRASSVRRRHLARCVKPALRRSFGLPDIRQWVHR